MKDRYGDPIRVGWSDRLGLALTLWSQLHASRAIGKFCRRMSYRSSSLSPVPKQRGCDRSKYHAQAVIESIRANVPLEAILKPNGDRRSKAGRKAMKARWRVWKAMRARGASLPAIGKIANRHHTSILSGLRRLEELERRDHAQNVVDRSLTVERLEA